MRAAPALVLRGQTGVLPMTQDNDPTVGPVTAVPGFLTYLPPAWLAVVMLLSLQGLLSAFPVLGDSGLPSSARLFIYASMAAGGVTVLWGLFVLALAYSRSQRFPRHFTAWQSALIAWQAVREAYVLIAPDFVFSASNLAWTAGEIAVGAFCIHLVRRDATSPAPHANSEAGAPSMFVLAVAAVLGVLGGAVVGFGIGILLGSIISEVTDMSCFEGACGYFAFFIGVLGLLVGAIAGGILAVWFSNRRRRKR